jgi:hypothetical protein
MRRWLLAVVLTAACGASVRRQARADWVYDECRALDDDSYVHPDTKRRCWQYWLDRYDDHQGAHRIAYAEDRVRENARAAAAPPEPEGGGGQETLPPGAPPPPDAQGGEGPPIVSPGTATPGTAAPARSCPGACHDLWRRCRDACGAHPAADCNATCDQVLQECIGDCRSSG